MGKWCCAAVFAVQSVAIAQAQDDVARVLQSQTQELFDAVSRGDAGVWDRYLDANVIYLSEDGTRKTKADLSPFSRWPRQRIRRSARGA